MVKQRLFLGSVAFGISFGISFLMSRNLGTAIGSGVTTTVAAVAASVLVDRQHDRHAQIRIADLKTHIQALQQRRAEAYQDYVELEAAKQQLAANLNTLALQSGQPQPPVMGFAPNVAPHFAPKLLPASHPPAAQKPLSWNLAAPVVPDALPSKAKPTVKPYELPTEIPADGIGQAGSQPWSRSETEISPQILSDAAAKKQRIETSLAALQAELSQIKGHITDHRQTREKLSRDVANVREEKRQLEATAKTLKGEVQELETCRVELEQFLSYAEAKKQELETGTNPLQEALKQLQTQVELRQDELRVLEAQMLDRRSQKELLEEELAALNALHNLSYAASPELSVPAPELKTANGAAPNGSNGNGHTATPSTTNPLIKNTIAKSPTVKDPIVKNPSAKPVTVRNPIVAQDTLVETPVTRPPKGSTAAVLPPIATATPSSDLPPEWTELMVQLPEYELQVLKVIVEQNHPAAVLKQIAEENLTMPELLIDSINERALDTIGDLLIDASSGAGSAAIVRDHLKAVKKLLKTYEHLAN